MSTAKNHLPAKHCKGCGRFFTPHCTQELYCSDACRTAYHHRKYQERHGVVLWRDKSEEERTRVCRQCGKSFVAKNAMQLYCSLQCRLDANRKAACQRSRQQTQNMREVREARKKRESLRHVSHIDEAAAKAREMGISYGRYKALARIEAMHADFRRG